jgi:NADH-quinone oxidoreductase subunit G
VGLRPSLWASDEVDISPSLAFLRARQVVELSAADAAERGINDGDRVEVGGAVEGIARVRAAVPAGTVFLIDGAIDAPGNLITDAGADVVRLATNGDASAVPVLATPAAEGLAEMPPSAPLDLPPTQGQPS